MGVLLIFTTFWLCIVNVKTESLEFGQIGIKMCESKCKQCNLCLGISYEVKTLHCKLLMKKSKEDKTNPEITVRYLHKEQVANMAACRKGDRILSPRTAEKKCVQDETSDEKKKEKKEKKKEKKEKKKEKKNCQPPEGGWCKSAGFNAVRLGNLSKFKRIISRCCDFSSMSYQGKNVLHLAASGGSTIRSDYLQLVRFIVSENIVPIDTRSSTGFTAVMFAVARGRGDIFKFLVGKHCNVSLTNVKGSNILHVAVKTRQIEVVRYILENHLIDVNVFDHKGKTPFDIASSTGQKKMARYLRAYQMTSGGSGW